MAYEFVPRKEYKEAAKIAREFIQELQRSLKSYLIVDRSLIGSVKSRLVTRNGEKEPFDFDYQFEIRKVKNMEDSPKKIIETILKVIQSMKNKFGFDIAQNNSRTFRLKYKRNNSNLIWFNLELAILRKIDDVMNIIYFDKNKQNIIYNQEVIDFANDRELRSKFQSIRKNTDLWFEFKKKYLEKKNNPKYGDRKSISIYKETVNEFYQKYFY